MPPPFRFWTAAIALAAAHPLAGAPAPTPVDEQLVQLPPFLVQSTGGPPWRYTHPPGFEILSRWSDSSTESLAQALAQAKQLFDAILPPELQAHFSVPTAFVLVTDAAKDVLSKALVTQVLARASRASSKAGGRPTDVRFLPNLMLSDRDALIIYSLKSGEAAEGRQLIFSGDRVRIALERRVPALPRWFIDGFCYLYSGMDFSQGVAATGTLGWLSAERSTALATNPESPRSLMPLGELFANPPVGGRQESEAHAALRQAEAALFIRWGLDGAGQPRRTALWRLVTASSAAPVNEQQFAALFGDDFTGVLNDLSDYLPWAVAHSLRLTPSPAPAVPEIRLRDATPAEVGRIKGDWERLEMKQVAGQFPELAPKYQEHALTTLGVAYQQDKTDPGLLAVMGLCALDAGDPARAEPLLAAAAAGHAIRPRAYFELARLQFADAIKALHNSPEAPLSAAQAAPILELLDHARTQTPALPEVYALDFQVWQATAAAPTAAQVQVFQEGAGLFPGNPALIYEAAVGLASGGYLTAANEILQQGLRLPATPLLQNRMAKLQLALASALRRQGAPSGPH